MRVLITGIKGFIGSHLANKFAGMGHEVIGIDHGESQSDIKVYDVDILSGNITSVLEENKPELIIHCAGLADVTYSMNHSEEDFKANTWMVYKVLNAMKESELCKTRFVLLSSAAVYGQPESLPIMEEAVLHPISPYALHKKMAEDICQYFVMQQGFDIRILRVFSAYGPGLKKQIFWDMYQKITATGRLELFGSGEESRDYIFIEDLAEAVYLIAMDRKKSYTVWNVANGIEVTIREVAEIFAQAENLPLDKVFFNGQIRSGDPTNWCADISRLKSIGFEGKTDILAGIKRYIGWINNLGR